MATFTIVANELTNNPPYQTGALYIELEHGQSYTFTKDDFTINTIPEYKDPEDDDLLKIKFIQGFNTKSKKGDLTYNNTTINLGTEVPAIDIADSKLVYTPPTLFQNTYVDIYYFDVADEGSETYGGLQGRIEVLVGEKPNLPPQVGDGEETIDFNDTLVFTRDMFTTQTTPPYYDPEGDAALLLKIVTLPTKGELRLLNNDTIGPAYTLIEEDQIIDFSDIDNGLLVFKSNIISTNSVVTVDFQFGIADEGSGVFTY